MRIARPSHDLRASGRFWAGGLGLAMFLRIGEPAGGDHALVRPGWPGAARHLDLARDPDDLVPAAPTGEDLLVLCLGGGAGEDVIGRRVEAGGTRVTARNPYWDQWGVTITDPDGYRLVLSTPLLALMTPHAGRTRAPRPPFAAPPALRRSPAKARRSGLFWCAASPSCR